MNKISILSLFVSCMLLPWSCHNNSEKNELAHDHHHDHSHEHGHDHGGHSHESEEEEDAINISPEKAEKLGIEATPINYENYSGSIKVTGEIIAPPSSRRVISATAPGIVTLPNSVSPGKKVGAGQLIASISSAEIAGGNVLSELGLRYDAAKREVERLTPLHEKGVVSTKEYNRAVTEMESARAALGNKQSSDGVIQVKAPVGGTLSSLYVGNGDYVEAGQVIGVIGDNSLLTLKADLPRRYHSKESQIRTAYIIPPCGDCPGFVIEDYNGKRLDGDISVKDSKSSFLPIYFTFNNPGSIEGSGYVDVYLKLDEKKNALVVPSESLVEEQGQWWLYVKLDEDCYEKRAVKPGNFGGDVVEIVSGLNPGEEVVTKGVTFVKLAENSGVIPEGHSHSH